MVTYKIIVGDREYKDVCYYNSLTLNKVEIDVEFSPSLIKCLIKIYLKLREIK